MSLNLQRVKLGVLFRSYKMHQHGSFSKLWLRIYTKPSYTNYSDNIVGVNHRTANARNVTILMVTSYPNSQSQPFGANIRMSWSACVCCRDEHVAGGFLDWNIGYVIAKATFSCFLSKFLLQNGHIMSKNEHVV